MKPAIAVATLLALPFPSAFSQEDATLAIGPAEAAETGIPDLPPPAPAPEPPPEPAAELPSLPGDPQAPGLPVAPPVEPVAPPADLNAAGAPAADPAAAVNQEIQESEEGYLIKDAPINDIFQFLAKQAGRQYFHNAKLAAPDFRVTGHLNDGDPLQQMEELAFMYGLTLYTKGNTIYALS